MINCIVIDDDQDTVNIFCKTLNMIGLDVLATGNNGMEAVELYERYRPNLIFVDLSMPVYDGFYAIERIRDVNPNAKIIIITGDLKAGESHLLDSFNVTSIIYKPFDIQTIKSVLADIFSV
ncbi:MAG: response regulator [Nitrosarchaeum sp.]|nr:response regulator [Nitrosarchaeum sp.]